MNGANHSQQIVQKLWNYCTVLRDDGLSYGDYLEQSMPERRRATQAAWPLPRPNS